MKNKENEIFKIVLLAFILITLILSLILVKKRQLYQKKAAIGHPASLSLQSGSSSYSKGATFDVNINLSTGNATTSGTAVDLRFDPNVFEALLVTAGKDLPQPTQPLSPPFPPSNTPMYPNVIRSQINNTSGIIYLDAGVNITSPIWYRGQGIFGRVQFKVKDNAPVGQSTISFYLKNLQRPFDFGDCDVAYLEGANTVFDILGQVNNLVINVTGAGPTPTSGGPTPTPGGPTLTPTLTPVPTATVTPAGPTPTTNPHSPLLNLKINFFGVFSTPTDPTGLDYQNQAVKIIVKNAASGSVVYEGTATFKATSQTDTFYYENSQARIIPNVEPGTYHLYLKGPKHLQRKFSTQNLVTGEQTLDFSSLDNALLGGDLPLPQNGDFNNLLQDGKVNSMDYAFLVNNFNQTETNYIKVGDLNLDGIINAGDAAVLAATLAQKVDDD